MQVYGVELQLLESDTNNIKKYVLINKLTHFNLVTESPNEDFKALISMLSLAHIFMNKGICSERTYCQYYCATYRYSLIIKDHFGAFWKSWK